MNPDAASHAADLDALECFIAENDDLLDLEARIGRFNIFDALGVAKAEIRHSNFLAWLLNPAASHGQGDLFLKSVVMDILRKSRAQDIVPAVSPITIDEHDLHAVEVRREWRSIDLLVVSREPEFVFLIENKIGSSEHSNQLERYEATVREEFPRSNIQFIFMTRDGDEPSRKNWVAFTYEDLYRALSRAVKQASGALGNDVAVVVNHYLSLIGTRFMDSKEIVDLCQRIRANHRRAIDLIIEHTGGDSEPLLQAFAERIRTNFPDLVISRMTGRDVRATPKSWLDVLPPIGDGDDPRAWLAVRFVTKNDRCWLGIRTSTVTDIEQRNVIIRALINPANGIDLKPSFKTWESNQRVMLKQERVASWGEEEEPNVDEIVNKAAKMIPTLLTKLENVPAVIAAASKQIRA